MKKLKFRSNILEKTTRYSDDFWLPDFIYNENGIFDRKKTMELLLTEEYGYIFDDGVDLSVIQKNIRTNVYAGKCKQHIKFEFTLTKNGESASFDVDLFIPNTDEKYPLIVDLDFSLDTERCYCPIEELMDRSVAVARVLYTEITSDDDDFSNGIARLVSNRTNPLSAGKLAIWAYAASLIGNYMISKKYVRKDMLYVAGHSRLGKAALLAAAMDINFAGVHSNNSGCSGVAISREKDGETVAKIYELFPYWFVPNYKKYSHKEKEMPFDQHYLTALIAPRKLSVATAEEDTWADTEAQYLSLEAASVIYEKIGITGLDHHQGLLTTGHSNTNGQIGLMMRKGTHYFSRDDWNFFIDFIKQ